MKQLCIKYNALASIRGLVNLPASKSIANRALIVASLGGFVDKLINYSSCDDTHVVIEALLSATHTPNVGAAGTAMRFFTAYYALQEGVWELSGSERMHQRPIAVLVDALRSVGAEIEYMQQEGYPPLRITGKKLRGGSISLSGAISSQYISALLMIAPCMQEGLTLHLTGNVVSVPYIEMTLSLMRYFGVESSFKGNTIVVAPQKYVPASFTVENDWSAASYWYAVTALHASATIELPHLLQQSWQGDAQLVRLFQPLGVKTVFTQQGIVLSKEPVALPKEYVCNLASQPDLAQTLVVVCLLLNVPFCFSGLGNLRIKETDRIAALITECKKMGYVITEVSEGVLQWDGNYQQPTKEIVIDTYDDHRMAMAFAPAVVKLGTLRINEPQVVSKSYPQFWEEFTKLLQLNTKLI
ncbi:MAG: 3-phosphoshikimate 1-carboxyvinyltransferase [Paludibacteraceae bacterium]|nr:3-phosphoshikimate 1-carboxyvinyltransferase [Paludibacteraceae bacterium]